MKRERKIMRWAAFAVACAAILIAVTKYEPAGVAAIAAAFALIADILNNAGGPDALDIVVHAL